MPTEIKKELLEELIYDRVRTRLAIRELRALDEGLRKSIASALRGLGHSREERDTIALEMLEKAWQRVGREAGATLGPAPEMTFRPAVSAA